MTTVAPQRGSELPRHGSEVRHRLRLHLEALPILAKDLTGKRKEACPKSLVFIVDCIEKDRDATILIRRQMAGVFSNDGDAGFVPSEHRIDDRGAQSRTGIVNWLERSGVADLTNLSRFYRQTQQPPCLRDAGQSRLRKEPVEVRCLTCPVVFGRFVKGVEGGLVRVLKPAPIAVV